MPHKTLTRNDVAKNNTDDSLWFVIDSKVYDVTDFVDAHPGGEAVLKQVAGQDATEAFYNLHRQEVLQKYSSLCIGTIDGEKSQVLEQKPGDLSAVPYGEPTWLTPQFKSPYFKDSHRRLQKAMRVWTDTELYPVAQECEKTGKHIPQDLIDKMSKNGILHMRLGPGKHLHGVDLMDGAVKGEKFDYFHDMIVTQEMVRANARGFQDGNMAGMTISLTAVLQFANDDKWKNKIAQEVFSGEKKICLAITEAFAGSDVAGLRTTAEKTKDGKHYIVNGTKKWITNGVFCDYFVTGVKTDKGLSVVLIERGEGVETSAIKTSYSAAAGTAYVTFDNVKVPVEHLLGVENKGIQVILSNFNHERWMMACAVIRMSRLVTEECMKWSNQRLVFGKKLIEQPVIRQKLAKAIALCESNQAYLENITYQMTLMPYKEQSTHLAGPIGLLKVTYSPNHGKVYQYKDQISWGLCITVEIVRGLQHLLIGNRCLLLELLTRLQMKPYRFSVGRIPYFFNTLLGGSLEESITIEKMVRSLLRVDTDLHSGGRALTQSGMGKTIEMFHRTYKFDAILGGAEEILGDLGVRQAIKNMPKSML